LLLTSFLIGVLFSSYIAKVYDNILLKTSSQGSFNNQKDLDLSDFWDTYNILKENYYDAEDLKKEDLVHWMTKGLIDSMWDRHSEFMVPEEKEKFEEVLSGDFEWIW